jgi:uncharacterized protein (TIGR01777 family)
MRIAITGGGGVIGAPLVRQLMREGHTVTVLTRNPAALPLNFASRIVLWSPTSRGDWLHSLNKCDVLFHLSRSPLPLRWTDEAREALRAVRRGMVLNLTDAISRLPDPPKTFVCASSHDFYGSRDGSAPLCEDAGSGDDFLATLYAQVESDASSASAYGVKIVRARIGAVLGPGAVNPMIIPHVVADPDGALSWVHITDVVKSLLHVVDHPEISGPVNIVAPTPSTAIAVWHESMQAKGRPVTRRFSYWNERQWAYRPFKSHWVHPRVLEKTNYRWSVTTIRDALLYLKDSACPNNAYHS